MSNDKRFTRDGYKIWDNVENEEFYELHYRYECDDMCRELNKYEDKVNGLLEENKQLKEKLSEQGVQLDFLMAENTHMGEVINESKKLKQINKGQKLEIVRLHKLADAMSSVLRELGIYDVYNEEQINSVKERLR